MSNDVNGLRDLLSKSRSKAAKKICSEPPARLEKGDFARIETVILSHKDTGDNVAELLELVRQIAVQAGTNPDVLKQSRIVIKYPMPKNPFAAGKEAGPFRDAERTYKEAAAWCGATSKAKTPCLSFYRFLVFAILEFRLLHQDYCPAILRSLGEDRVITLTSQLKAVPLSLSFGRQQNAERRLLILRRKSLSRFRDFLKSGGQEKIVEAVGSVNSEMKVGKWLAKLQRVAAKEGAELGVGSAPPSLAGLMEQARILAMLNLPSVVVAHRSRLLVSHSLPPEVLGRITGRNLPPFAPPRSLFANDAADPEQPEPAAAHDEPGWMAALREALNPNGLDVQILEQLAQGWDLTPRLLAEFAKFLDEGGGSRSAKKAKGCTPGTVRRYCLLIALKLIPRLDTQAIEEITQDSWEDAIEQLLDEDAFYNLKRYSDSPKSSAQAHTRPLVTAIRHWLHFLKQRSCALKQGADLGQIEKRLPVLGLVAVDANLITVDEFSAALKRMVGIHGPDDEDELEAGRVALILGYRCGLRRSEAAGLSVCDLDSIDYLHVRANEMRTLKTSNAKRDLPLRVLMPHEELEHVRRRASQIRLRADSAKLPYEKAYLFSRRDTPNKLMAFERVVARIHWAFRGDAERDLKVIDSTFHYHRLRHSFCNLTLLRLWPALAQRVIEFFPGENCRKTREWIRSETFRQDLFGTDRITQGDLQGLALLMGHGSAAVSLEHYTHVLDFFEGRMHSGLSVLTAER